MTDINKVTVIGRLTKGIADDEKSFSYLSNGTAVARVSIAVNRSVKKGDKWEDEASFFDVTIWGKTAENLKPYLIKGKQIAIDGYLKQDRWQKDGQNFSKIGIVAENVMLLGGDKSSSNNNNTNNFNNVGSSNSNLAFKAKENALDVDYSVDGFTSDIPF